MGEGRKFAALAGIRQQTVPESAEVSPPQAPVLAPATIEKLTIAGAGKGSRGRPAGKRSDPEFQPTTVLLRKATKKAVNRKLEDINARQDLSDLIEQLLSGWVKRQA